MPIAPRLTDVLELTMGLLARSSRSASKQSPGKGKNVGYIAEFLDLVLAPHLDTILEKKIKVVTNAGGLDPVGLKNAIDAHIQQRGLSGKINVAAVSGDDLLPEQGNLIDGEATKGFDPISGASSEEEGISKDTNLLSLNAYIGAEPIAAALRGGASIVVTGRCVDSALVLGPLAYEYGWDFDTKQHSLDQLASASLAGHVIECGCQAIGGNYTDWRTSAASPHGGWANMGYPILTYNEDNSFFISKPDKTGGIVNCQSVCEQILYEVLDPENYVLPDVVVDMSQVRLEQADTGVVLVRGAKGKPPTPWLKCTAVEQKGFRLTVDMLVCGEEAESKANALGKAIIDRTNALASARFSGAKISPGDSEVILIGGEYSLGQSGKQPERREIVLRVAARHKNRSVLDILSKESAPFLTNSCPGICLLTSGRPKTSPNFAASSVLVHRSKVRPQVHHGTKQKVIDVPLFVEGCKDVIPAKTHVQATKPLPQGSSQNSSSLVKLHSIAIGRSGDKGDTANIAIIARDPSFYPYILEQVTPDVIFSKFRHFIAAGGTVTRFEVPGVHAVNFVLTKSLGGGGLSSLRLDR